MFIEVGDAIIERLNEQIPDIPVYTAEQLSELEERAQTTPALHVIYSGFRPTRDVANGLIQEIETLWTVVVAVRSARRRGVSEKAAPIFNAAVQALAGWKPAQGITALKLSSSPGAAHNPGFSYYPIQFTVQQTVRGSSQ